MVDSSFWDYIVRGNCELALQDAGRYCEENFFFLRVVRPSKEIIFVSDDFLYTDTLVGICNKRKINLSCIYL